MILHLVPSERQVDALAREGQGAITFRALVLELANAQSPDRERAGPEVTRLIAENIAPEPELADLLDSGLGVLRKLGVDTDMLAARPGARARLFAEALQRADAELERAKLRDERADIWLAAQAISTDVLPGVREVIVSAYARLGAGELQLLERLHLVLRARGGGVTLAFPAALGEEAGRAVDALQSRLEAHWAEANDAPGVIRDERPGAERPFMFTRTPNMASEARAVVRAVQDRLSAGARLDRIAIVPLELSEAFLEELRSALLSARIPFSEPRGRPPIAGPNVHATLEVLRLAAGPIRRDALLDVLSAPGLRPERWFGEGGRSALLALRDLLARVPVGFDRDGSLLLARARFLVDQRPDARRSAALDGLGKMLSDLRALAAHRTRAELVRELSQLIESLGLLQVPPRVLSLALSADDQGQKSLLTALSDDARGAATLSLALTRVVEAAEQLGMAQSSVSPRELSAELLRAMEGVGVGRGAARAAAIAVAGPAEVAGLPLDLAVICRASAANFSKAGATSETLWLGAELSESLPRGRRPPSARDEEAAVLTALSALLNKAEHAELVWSTSDGSGDTPASRFVESLMKHARAQERSEPGSPLSPGARRIVALPAPTSDVLLRAEVERQRQAFFFNPSESNELTGRVSELSAWVGPGLPPLPVTRLERYVDCAFLGFSSIVLRASRDEGVTDALGVRERGILIHAAVAEALAAIAGLDRPDDELLALALEAADATLAQHAGSSLRGAALRTTRGDVRSLVRWSLENRDYTFRHAEKGFGDGEPWPALELGRFRLSGRIDRIDLSSDGKRARVIDYKSGNPPSASEKHALQGWLYARKVALELGTNDVQSLYLGLSRRVPVPKLIFSGTPEAADLAERESVALDALHRLHDGQIAARPSRPARCARCDARDLCRRPLSAPLNDDGEES